MIYYIYNITIYSSKFMKNIIDFIYENLSEKNKNC